MITDSEKLRIIRLIMNGDLANAIVELYELREREEIATLPGPNASELEIAQKDKIGAIKAFRSRTGATLYAAKTMIERALM